MRSFSALPRLACLMVWAGGVLGGGIQPVFAQAETLGERRPPVYVGQVMTAAAPAVSTAVEVAPPADPNEPLFRDGPFGEPAQQTYVATMKEADLPEAARPSAPVLAASGVRREAARQEVREEAEPRAAKKAGANKGAPQVIAVRDAPKEPGPKGGKQGRAAVGAAPSGPPDAAKAAQPRQRGAAGSRRAAAKPATQSAKKHAGKAKATARASTPITAPATPSKAKDRPRKVLAQRSDVVTAPRSKASGRVKAGRSAATKLATNAGGKARGRAADKAANKVANKAARAKAGKHHQKPTPEKVSRRGSTKLAGGSPARAQAQPQPVLASTASAR